MILDRIEFKRHDIEIRNDELLWKYKGEAGFNAENMLRCNSEITSLFPLMDKLFITTLNGCLYRVLFPDMGPLYLSEYMIKKK